MSVYHAWPVLLLGIASTTQTHLAKALERQGIGTLDMVRARLRRTGEQIEGGARVPLVYIMGLVLNHTTFLYHLFVAPLGGTTALYTSMYGVGLVVLLAYSTAIVGERISRRELAGALCILAGTLVIGLEGISRPPLDMASMDLGRTLVAVLLLLGLGAALLAGGLRAGSVKATALTFGLCAGACGALDPFLKAVGQTAGGGGSFLPGGASGWIVLAFSFVIGEVAVLVTQWGFYRRARASILVPAYNCSYIGVPVVLQAVLLPGYVLYFTTGAGLALIMAGFVLIRGFGREERPVAQGEGA